MAQLDPKMLLAAAMQGSQGMSGIGGAQSAIPASSAPAAGPPPDSQQDPQTAVSGLPTTGNMSNVDLATLVAPPSNPDTLAQMTQLLQDPSTPPQEKQAIQMRLQLGAMSQMAQGQRS